MRRLTMARDDPGCVSNNECKRCVYCTKPSHESTHNHLFRKQVEFFISHITVHREIAKSYQSHLAEFTTMDTEAETHHADPHAKKLLRVQAWSDLNESGRFDRLWLRTVTYKMKKDEIAKVGKVPRMIGDLGVAASLQGFRATYFLKKAQAAEPVYYKSGEIQFIPTPSPTLLINTFSKLIDPPGKYYMCIFSDDACLAVRYQGRVYMYNLDISKCDASHGDIVFTTLAGLTTGSLNETMAALLDQCKLPIVIRSRSIPSNCVVLQPKKFTLYSGSTLTTSINNWANINIGISIADRLNEFDGSDGILIDSAARAGYIVTCETCPSYHSLQFLKHSPVYDTNGRLRAVLNLGVLLRLSGTCKGDLPGSGDIKLRAQAFQKALLQGAYPYTSFTLIDRMKLQVEHARVTAQFENVIESMLEYKVGFKESDRIRFTVDDEELYKRYSLTALEQAELYTFGELGFGHNYCDSACKKILQADYGLDVKHH